MLIKTKINSIRKTFKYQIHFDLFLRMRKTINFIMSKKFIPVLFLFIASGLFLTYTTMGRGDKFRDDPKSKYEKILRNVGIILEEGHYSPKKIDDAFSVLIYPSSLFNETSKSIDINFKSYIV